MSVERGSAYGVKHFKVENAESLSDYLSRNLSDVKSSLQELVSLGAIYLNNKRLSSLDTLLRPQDVLRVHTEPRRFSNISLKSRIQFESADLIILDKPAGLPIHALTDNAKENVIRFLEIELGCPLFITHRLDIETSGLVILAKNKETQAHMNQLLSEKKIRKLYRAYTLTNVPPGLYTHFMQPSPKAPKIISEEAHKDWLLCQLQVLECTKVEAEEIKEFAVISDDTSCFRLDIDLLSGRSQQIRAQLAYLGAPILGDQSYGGIPSVTFERKIALQSYSLEFEGLQFTL